jgi:transcriptional regulator with XRE-family HTH domain
METPQFRNFGEWLFYWRKRLDLTQPEVGKEAHVSPQQISNLERGEPDSRTGKPATPSIPVLAKLCKLFKRPISEPIALILGMKIDIPDIDLDQLEKVESAQEVNNSPTQQVAKLRALFLQLPPERRPMVIEFIELLVAGAMATSFNRALDDALSPAYEIEAGDQVDEEKQEKPA